MRTLLALICSLALASVAGAQGESKSKKPTPKKTHAQSAQQSGSRGPSNRYQCTLQVLKENLIVIRVFSSVALVGRSDGFLQQVPQSSQSAQTAGAGKGFRNHQKETHYIGRNDGKVQDIVLSSSHQDVGRPTGGGTQKTNAGTKRNQQKPAAERKRIGKFLQHLALNNVS